MRNRTDRILALVGLALACLPFAATIGLTLVFAVTAGAWRVDWLMPGELSPSWVVGAALLAIVAWRADPRHRAVITAVAIGLVGLAATFVTPLLTGVGSGAQPATGWRLAVVLGSYLTYVLAAAATCVLGWSLARRPTQPPAHT